MAPELAQFNDLRTGLGSPAVRNFDDQFLKSDLFIAFTAEPYEYHRSDWPQQVRLVGPGLWEPPADPPAGGPSAAATAVDELLAASAGDASPNGTQGVAAAVRLAL